MAEIWPNKSDIWSTAIRYSETSVDFCRNTLRYNPENRTPHKFNCPRCIRKQAALNLPTCINIPQCYVSSRRSQWFFTIFLMCRCILSLSPTFDICSTNRSKSNKSTLKQTQLSEKLLIRKPCLKGLNTENCVSPEDFVWKQKFVTAMPIERLWKSVT